MGFITVMCYPLRQIYLCKTERMLKGTVDIYRQQIMFVKTDKPSMRQRRWTPIVILAIGEIHKHMFPAAHHHCLQPA